METNNQIFISHNKKGLNIKTVPLVHTAVKSACQVFFIIDVTNEEKFIQWNYACKNGTIDTKATSGFLTL